MIDPSSHPRRARTGLRPFVADPCLHDLQVGRLDPVERPDDVAL